MPIIVDLKYCYEENAYAVTDVNLIISGPLI